VCERQPLHRRKKRFSILFFSERKSRVYFLFEFLERVFVSQL
jgi:hypothetical protein